jgi:DUF1009 family protein
METGQLQPDEERNHRWRFGLVAGNGRFPYAVQEDSQGHGQEGEIGLTQTYLDLPAGTPVN